MVTFDFPDDICANDKLKEELFKSALSTILAGGQVRFRGVLFKNYKLLVAFIEAFCKTQELKAVALRERLNSAEYLETFRRLIG